MTSDASDLDGGASHAQVIARSRDGRSFVRRHVVEGRSMILKALVHDSDEASLESEAEWFRRSLAGDARAAFVAVQRIGGKLVLRLPDLGRVTLHDALQRRATSGRRLSSTDLRELGRGLFVALNRLALAGVEHRALDATHVVLAEESFDRLALVGFKHARRLEDSQRVDSLRGSSQRASSQKGSESGDCRSDVAAALHLLFVAATYHDSQDVGARRTAMRQLDREDGKLHEDAKRLARFFTKWGRAADRADPFALGQEWTACFSNDAKSASDWPIPSLVTATVLAATFGALRSARAYRCVVAATDLEPGLTLAALRVRPAWSTTSYGRAFVRGIARALLEQLVAAGAVVLRTSFAWGRPFPWFARCGMELAPGVASLRDLIACVAAPRSATAP